MQAVGIRRSLARRALLAAGALLGATLAVSPARADAVSCTMQGEAPGFQVYRLDLALGGGQMTMGLAGGAGIYGVVDKSNYYSTEGIEIFNAQTGALEAWHIRGVSGQRPRILVSSGSQTLIDQELVGPQVPLGWSTTSNPGGLSAGSHYVVAFGFGGGRFNDFVSLAVRSGTATCQQVTPSGADLIQYDQTDFESSGQDLRTSGQVYLIAAGGGGGLTLSFDVARRFFVGYFSTGFSFAPYFGSDSWLLYTTPTSSGRVTWGHSKVVVSAAGRYSFSLRYTGLLVQHANIDGWALDLP